jgi:hypothetical protein
MSDNYSIVPLIGIVLVIMLGFAAFFISFLLAPLAVLAIFYLFLYMRERSRSRGEGPAAGDVDLANRIAREREAREREMEREREGVPVEELLAAARGEQRANGGSTEDRSQAR